MLLERLDEKLFTHAAPLSFLGLHLGTRMTIVQLDDGGLWIHSPVRLTPALRAEVDALGPVRHVVAPNLYHHLFAGEWASAYPGSTLYGPAALTRKRKDLTLSAPLEEASRAPWATALVPVRIDGARFHETVFVHPRTRTLVSADLVENFATSPHAPTRLYLKLSGIHGKAGIAAPLRMMYGDRSAARRSIDALLEHDFERIVLAHGDILGADGPATVQRTYAFLGAKGS
jgi:hypothetical protein